MFKKNEEIVLCLRLEVQLNGTLECVGIIYVGQKENIEICYM